METQSNNTQAAIEAGKQLMTIAANPVYINSTPFITLPENVQLVELDHLREYPLRITRNQNHGTVSSFIAYYQRFANENSVILLNQSKNTFEAIFDFHSPDQADFLDHRAKFGLIDTPEWKEWSKNDKKTMNQSEFGQFIESNLEEIIDPEGAQMLEIALSMQAKTNVKFSSAIRLDNGQTAFSYVEDIDSKAGINGQLKIPEKFTIGLKLYEGGEAYKIDARFRYRIKDGNLIIWYELIRPHKTINANLDDTKKLITEQMGIGHFYEEA